METRTAPEWIREAERRYERGRRMWVCATWAMAVVFLGLGFGGAALHAVWLSFLAVWCIVPFLAWSPIDRARRCGAAADIVNAAIVRYEVSADRPESTLTAADRRAKETARVQRIRTAPDWIKEKRRRCLLKLLGWISPVLAALALAPAAAAQHLPWARHWLVYEAYLLNLVGLLTWRSKLLKAYEILNHAIAHYEYESAATEADLAAADGRASEALFARAGSA